MAKTAQKAPQYEDAIELKSIFLSLDNPRHEPVKSEPDAISYLCENELVLPLARDIVQLGINPLELFALVPISNSSRSGSSNSYYVAEGNRRLCALKLLDDPDRAPKSQQSSFKKLAAKWKGLKTVPAMIFDKRDSVDIWLGRIHAGEQGGIGRKSWRTEQQGRFDGTNKNKAALELLSYAEEEGMISATERKRKVTTAQRFLGNDDFRKSLGLERKGDGGILRTRPKEQFDVVLKKFVRDLVAGHKVTSRMNAPAIETYGRSFEVMEDISDTRVKPSALTHGSAKVKLKRRTKPSKPQPIRTVQHEPDIKLALDKLGNEKLKKLYYSITSVELEDHTPLIAIGTWAFLETLTACAGRNDGTSFEAYLDKNRLENSYGLTGKSKSLTAIIRRISEYGNSTKHHPVAAIFSGGQVNNDMVALKEVILKCIASVK